MFDHIYCSYSTIAWALAASSHHQLHDIGTPRAALAPISYHLPKKLPSNTGYPQDSKGETLSDADYVFHVFNALGVFAFTYAGHNVVMEIQNELPSKNHNSKDAMMKGVWVAYVLIAICYTLVLVFGYWAYGNQITDDFLTFVSWPKQVVIIANVMVVIHIIGSYQVHSAQHQSICNKLSSLCDMQLSIFQDILIYMCSLQAM